jgi:hypothetical protein
MRVLLLLLGSAIVVPAFAAPADDAKAIVAKGLAAIGGKEGDPPKGETYREEGSLFFGENAIEFQADQLFVGPDNYRMDLAMSLGGQDAKIVFAVKGDKVWQSMNGMLDENVAAEKVEYGKITTYQTWVLSLYPLLSDKDFKLTTIPGIDVEGKPAVGVSVERAGKPTVKLYFDKAEGHLVKTENKNKDEFQGWKEVVDEAFLSDYQKVGDRKYFTKMKLVRDGKKLIESKLSKQQRLEKADLSKFDPPK